MLNNTLNTNEVKNRLGTEVEFVLLENSGQEKAYKQVAETPSQPHRIFVKHEETGTAKNAIRRSGIIIDKTVMSQVDSITPVRIRCVLRVEVPVGHLTDLNAVTDAVAEMLSFAATDGSGTTVLFNGTGNGASAIINGTL